MRVEIVHTIFATKIRKKEITKPAKYFVIIGVLPISHFVFNFLVLRKKNMYPKLKNTDVANSNNKIKNIVSNSEKAQLTKHE